MLGRTAASLFWMSRYVERAENMARLLQVGYRISLMPSAIEGHRDDWRSTLTSAASETSYFRSYKEITTAEVIRHLLFDESNPSSVRSCVKAARNNGRAVRTALTRDLWESLNGTWNELAQVKPQSITADRLPVFLDWIKQRAMLFRGALLGTLLRGDSYYFSQLGTFIERADNTARILDVKYYILLPQASDVGSDLDAQQWATLVSLALPRWPLPSVVRGRIPHLARADATLPCLLLSVDQYVADRPRGPLWQAIPLS
jgi:uncharacterized alpha-E superfamily protein